MFRFLSLILICLCVGCGPLATPLPQLPTDVLEPSSTPTPTKVWFPPTATLPEETTPAATLIPSPETNSVHGELYFKDDFTDPSQWSLIRTNTSTAAIDVNELTLAISRPKGYIYSLRQDTQMADFYLEITATPSLCRAEDEYGLLLRVSPNMEFYRFSLTCDGQVRLDKFYKNQASSPQPLLMSGVIPRGAPSRSQLAVEAIGKELNFYANGEHLFSVRDPALSAGTIGVFARASGDSPVTVNFSDLRVYAPQP